MFINRRKSIINMLTQHFIFIFLFLFPSLFFPLQPPSSTTPPIDITPSRLKLMRRSTDRKSEFLRGLKDERNGDMSDCHSPGAPAEVQMNSSLICRFICLHLLILRLSALAQIFTLTSVTILFLFFGIMLAIGHQFLT